MSADKTTAKIGTLLTGDEERDAIHVAVAPAVAAQRLHPGLHVALNDDGEATTVTEKPIGIVDPYLTTPVQAGEAFFIFLYPGTITSLRHDWTHPAFGPKPEPLHLDKSISETWLRAFADTADCPGYDWLIKAATTANDRGWGEEPGWSNDGEYLTVLGTDAGGDIPPEFWHHVQVVTGKSIPSDKHATRFSCSC